MIAALAAGMGVSGCKTFTVTFVDETPDDLRVSLSGPGKITPSQAEILVAGGGGSAQFKVQVNDSDLPVTYTWQAGLHRGSLPVEKDSPDARVVHITIKVPGPTTAEVEMQPQVH